MAKKKQTIILTHGSLAPTAATTGFTQGEVLVQHAENSVDTSLYTLNEQNEWVRIPSKDYIDGQDEVLSGSISALEKQIEDLDKDKPSKDSNMSVTLTGDVTGSGTTTLGTGTISIEATVDGSKHDHVSSGITDSISTLTACTTASTELVQGKVVKAVDTKVDALDTSKADKSTNISVALTGDVTGNGSVSLTGGTISIVAAVTDNSHNHVSSNISDSISDLTKCTTTSAELVQGKVVKAVDVKVEALDDRIDALEGEFENGDVSKLISHVNALIDGDWTDENKTTPKSVRAIANEELVKQLIPENATEALDTLQEIAQWIQDHPADAAEMNEKITALEENKADKTGNMSVTLTGDVTGSGTTTLGTGTISIEATVDGSKHDHVSSGITDSISTLTACTTASTELVQGKVVKAVDTKVDALDTSKADKSTNISVALTGDVTGNGSVSLTGGTISIVAAVTDNSHNHVSSNISDSISDLTKCTTTSAELVQGKVVKAVDAKVDALSETVGTINNSYVNEIVVTNTASNKITATKENHKYTFNFDNMVIDGGTY